MPVAAGVEIPGYLIKIYNTKFLWFYYSQGRHCQAGMVGVIDG